MAQIGFIALGFSIQYAIVFAWSYPIYRYAARRSANLQPMRDMARFVGVSGAISVLLILITRQTIVQDSWWWPFVSSFWVASMFAVHDFALGLAIRGKKSSKNISRPESEFDNEVKT